jgi:hypothetical protein
MSIFSQKNNVAYIIIIISISLAFTACKGSKKSQKAAPAPAKKGEVKTRKFQGNLLKKPQTIFDYTTQLANNGYLKQADKPII